MFSKSKPKFSDTVSTFGWPNTRWPDTWGAEESPPSQDGSRSFFFPGQFAARPALVCLAEMATAQGVPISAVQLAQRQGIELTARLGVQDLISAAGSLGLSARLELHPPATLARLDLPVLAFLADGTHGMQLVTQCDGRYVLMHNHASVVPISSMLPLANLATAWVREGRGWVLWLQRCPSAAV